MSASSPGHDPAPLVRRSIAAITSSYRNPIVRLYCQIRFLILHQVFLEEIGQYLPREGRILEFGCGFGLFSLFFASVEPRRRLVGVDLNRRRIAYARDSAERLGVRNVRYESGDAVTWGSEERFDAIYMLDLIHHLPPERVRDFLERTRDRLVAGGVLVVKDLADTPLLKRIFSWALDRLMSGFGPLRYWPPAELLELLEGLGFHVVRHRMNDLLPYPHIIYVARLAPAESGR